MRHTQFGLASILLGTLIAGGAATACSDTPGTGGTGGTAGTSTGGKAGTGGTTTGGQPGTGGLAGAAGTGGGPQAGAGGQGGSAGKGGAGGWGGLGGAGGGTGQIRLVHAAPNAGPVDIYWKGATTPVASLDYGTAFNYVSVPSGKYTVELRKKGDAATTPAIFTSSELVVDTNKKYTAVAAGILNSIKDEDKFRVLELTDSWLPATVPNIKLRLLHASPDAPPVSVNVNDDGDVPEIAELKPFADTGEAGFDVLATRAIQLGIAQAGTPLTAFTTPADIAATSDVLVIATGLVAKQARETDAFSLLVVLPDGKTTWVRQNPRLFALHASPDFGGADIYSGTREVIDNAGFGALAALQLPPGDYTLDLFAGQAGATTRPVGDPVFSGITPKLEAGKSYLATVAGKNADKTLTLFTQEEGFLLTDAANSRVRAILASSNSAAVDIGAVETTGNIKTPPLLANLKFKDAGPQEGLVFAPSQPTLGLAATGGSATIAEFKLPLLKAAQRGFAVVAGDATGGANALQLFFIDASPKPWTLEKIPNSKL